MKKILVVDDDPQSLESTRKILELAGYEVSTACDGQAALELVRPGGGSRGVELILTDVRMPRMGGLEFLRALAVCGDGIPVILMTAFGRIEDAVWAMKLGAVDFLTKPFKRQALLTSVEAALKRSRARGVERGASAARSEDSFKAGGSAAEALLGRSRSMRELRAMIAQVAPTSATVLITGESGTGKELVARLIHEESQRGSGRFVALNCAAVPEQLIESELFGSEKGAFTGAHVAREGLFEAAHRGTLLLDEIGEMPLTVQPKLLRALQEGEVRRVGANVSRKFDARLIAATNRDLKECARAGTFRQDLLYRLEVIHLHVAPLRERMEDLPDLAYHFLKENSACHGKPVTGISDEAMEALLAHSWPGNVRELANVIERGVVFAEEAHLRLEDLPAHLHGSAETAGAPLKLQDGSISVPLGTPLKEVEELLIRKTLEATDGDKNMTAKILGINSRTIYRKLDKRSEREPS